MQFTTEVTFRALRLTSIESGSDQSLNNYFEA